MKYIAWQNDSNCIGIDRYSRIKRIKSKHLHSTLSMYNNARHKCTYRVCRVYIILYIHFDTVSFSGLVHTQKISDIEDTDKSRTPQDRIR